MFMDRHMSESLDRYITGNYGEDQFKQDLLMDEELEEEPEASQEEIDAIERAYAALKRGSIG